MSKKRKTRAQKIRAQARRLTQLSSTPKPADSIPAGRISLSTKTDAGASASEVKVEQPAFRRADLKTSLRLLGILVAAQVAIWLLFSFTTLDDRIYSLLKL